MRALGKTPNDPLIQKMSPVQWKLCFLNVLEDEIEADKKIRDLVDIGIKMFVGSPEKKDKVSEDGFVGQEPTTTHPDINYVVKGTHGEETGIRKIMSTEFDRILKSGGKYQGFECKEESGEK